MFIWQKDKVQVQIEKLLVLERQRSVWLSSTLALQQRRQRKGRDKNDHLIITGGCFFCK
jgi:hypothetical protein